MKYYNINMKRMIWTKYENDKQVKRIVCFLSAYYKDGIGPRALVVCKDNQVHEVDPYDLSLPTAEYNKIFAE